MKTILIIDDDAVFISTVHKALTDKNYNVVDAHDGQEGLDIVKKDKPDLILVDILMPNIGGMDFLRIIKGNNNLKNIPVIIVSNFTSMNYVNEGLKLGAKGYIIKSNESLKTITDTVESIIETSTS